MAVTISITTFFNAWRKSYVEREFRTFQTLEKLRSLTDGDKLSEVQLLFEDLMPLDRELAKVVLSKPELSSGDEVFTATINESSARFLHFHDGALVNYKFTSKDMQDSLSSLQAPVPQWYIRYGHWLIVSVLLAVVGLLRVFVLTTARQIRKGN